MNRNTILIAFFIILLVIGAIYVMAPRKSQKGGEQFIPYYARHRYYDPRYIYSGMPYRRYGPYGRRRRRRHY